MAAETLEKVKIEIRSILLSSKYGVPAESIQSDYQMLMCQELPLKELGCKDVQSLMRTIPDVAEEVRSHTGEITYHAVCDESTAHIQKLVSHQVTKRKRTKFLAGRGKRHGALGRGGTLGKGGWSHGKRGSLAGGTKQLMARPRAPQTMNRSQPEYTRLASGDFGDSKSEHRGRVRNMDHLDVSATSAVKLSNTLRAVVGRGAGEPSNSQPDIDTGSYKQKFPVYNLRVGISPSGKREISKLLQPLQTNRDPSEGAPASQFDLRDLLNSKRASAASVRDHAESASNTVGRPVKATTVSMDSVTNQKMSPQVKDNRAYPRDLPPRFQRPQQQKSPVQDRPALSPVESLRDPQQHYSDENTVYSLDGDNWVPPKDGQLYLEAFNNYFAQRGEVAPKIEIIHGKLRKRKGFYGRLNHQDKYYYPLEIMQNEEHAHQNVVSAFCQKNDISLLHNGHADVNTANSSSSTSPAALEIQQVPSIQANSGQSPQPKVSCQERSTDGGNVTASQQKPSVLPETLKKVYQILKPNGIWLSTLPDLYKTAYQETLNVDFLSVASQWPQYFTIEKIAENRYTIYPVANDIPETEMAAKITAQVTVPPALQSAVGAENRCTIYPVANDIPETEMAAKITAQVMVPPALQPAVGSKLQMIFSFAYSAEDVYLQRADMENLAYEIADVLNKNCPDSVPPEVDSIVLNSLVAAIYDDSWYRAQVLAVEQSAVTVYFIDYGNKEKVSFADLRPIPQDLLILNTPSLAIRCALRKTKAGEWVKDVINFLTELSESNPTLSAEIVAHKGDQCIVDLYTLEESLVNDMLLRSVSSPSVQRLGEVGSRTPSVQRLGEVGNVTPSVQRLGEVGNVTPAVQRLGEVGNVTPSVQRLGEVGNVTPSVQRLGEVGNVTPAVQRLGEVGNVTKSAEQGTQQLAKTPPQSAAATRFFADDPVPLMLPDSDEFAVYVCRVMSESTVLLRIVDDEYSDKLDELEQGIADNFYSWSIPDKIRQSNIYACMVLATADDTEDVEYDEQGEEKVADQNKYHRVRVLKEHQDGSCDCYLPDHGHNETLNRSKLREIDPQLNISLSYQAVMARLHGLDNLPDKLKPMAVRLLIKLLTSGATLYAVKKGRSAETRKDDPEGVDVNVTNRVRKIISCMKDINPDFVAKVYQQVYGEMVENVEEIIKNIPGYGFWRESLVVDLFDTSQDDNDVNINECVLAAIEEMDKVQSRGGNVEDVWRDLFCSDTSQTDTDGGSVLDDLEGNERLSDGLGLVDAGVSQAGADTQPENVTGSVQEMPAAAADDSVKPASGMALYTWKTKPGDSGGAAAAACPTPTTTTTTQAASSATSAWDTSHLPKFWSYPLLTFVSLQIVRVENPSDFVAIPVEQRGALDKLEMAIAQYFSANKAEAVVTLQSSNVLYTVKCNDVYRRALYVSLIGDVVKVFFPDHHCYDMVLPSKLVPLPEQFYSLPFLARKMRLGGILPQGQDWPAHVTQWFKTSVSNKSLYALVTGEDSNSSDQSIPGALVVRLIDTSGSEDLVVDEYMESQGMAVFDPSNDSK